MITAWLWLAAWAAPSSAVRDALTLGDCEAVRAALVAPADDAERLARGWCASGPDDAEAVAALAAIQAGPLAPYARWGRAELHLAAQRFAEAVSALDGLDLPGDGGLQVRLRRGEALVRAGRSLEARDDLRALLDTSAGVEARFWLAEGGRDRDERDAAIATYERVWASGTRGGWAARAAEALASLGAPVPDFASDRGRALVRDRIAALKADHRHTDANALLERLGDEGGEPPTGLALARSRAAARDYAGAIQAYAAVLGPPERATGDAKALFDNALTHARTGDYATADVVYQRLMAQHPSHDLADFASFKRGYMAYDAGDCARARPLLEAHAARKASPRLDEALWFASRCAWREGDAPAVVALLDRLLAERPKSGMVPGAVYWRARAEGGPAERVGLEAVLQRFPDTAYAHFAAARLGRRFTAPAEPPAPRWPAALASHPSVVAGEALLAVGLPHLARDRFLTVASAAEGLGREGRAAYAWALARSGDPQGAKRAAAPLCPSASLLALCLQRPAEPIVARVAGRLGLDPWLPYAIMTAESNLDPSVTSPAGARGLMQVMPAEGARMHEAGVGGGAYDPERLYVGAYNAALGTAELGLRATSLRGSLAGDDLPAIIASYNAGEEAVRRWLAAYPGPPEPDVFAEDIGYTETRHYVRRVLGFRMAYRRAFGDP